MARPMKTGLDYFPLDCVPDGKLELFIAENGAEGFGILVILWRLIYKDEGYYIKFDNDLVLRIRRASLSHAETIENVINNALKRGIFDKSMYGSYGILTSAGIQKRYLTITERRKEVRVILEFLLIDVCEYKNLFIVNNNPENTGLSTQSKVKECKRKNVSFPSVSTLEGENRVKFLSSSFLKSPFRKEAYDFADWFRTLAPESVTFDRDAWAQVWEQLRRIDDRKNPDEMKLAIQWARADPFWSTNFFSPLKLRKRNEDKVMYIDIFLAKMKQAKYTENGTQNGRLGNQKPLDKAGAEEVAASVASDPRLRR
ncbi:hypothetical protein CR164_00390 [Prosthecochloris marina]|uniref:Lin1244/Lin1753-like N-terminal domain-containing protein n=2 Tax=Chlorobiaceae TaxID=191412 RepID=A0A317TBG1_9CHLB|nr:hypothetical protein CR164_00390 [Prosthecochloris marina]